MLATPRVPSLLGLAAAIGALVACGGTFPGDTTDTATATPAVQEDVFVQSRHAEVDVLWVVDDTAAAASLRTELAQSFPVFLDYFLGSGIDYHIGVVTTDMVDPDESGKLQDAAGALWLDDATVDPVGVFAGILGAVGGGAAAPTAGRDAAHAALDTLAATDNAGFARASAALVVVTASPAADASSAVTLADWIAWLDAARGHADLTSHVSIGALAGSDYQTVTTSVGGEDCGDPLYECLGRAGIHAAGYTHRYPLSQVPLPETIEVVVLDQGVTYDFGADDWSWDAVSNTVQFVAYVPNVDAQVTIRYAVAP